MQEINAGRSQLSEVGEGGGFPIRDAERTFREIIARMGRSDWLRD